MSMQNGRNNEKMLLNIQNLKKTYGNKGNLTLALNDISFSVDKGDFISIMGPSGSGKSTLLNCISTIDTASSGKIIFDGINLDSIDDTLLSSFRRENLGFIFQDFKLLDTLTVEENIILPLTLKKEKNLDFTNELRMISSQLKIENILNKFPYEISGGQKQRCAVARAFITHPKLILADEPTGALDSFSSKNLMQLFVNLNKNLCSTIILVTHDAFSASHAQKVMFLKDGRIYCTIDKKNISISVFYQQILDILLKMEGDTL